MSFNLENISIHKNNDSALISDFNITVEKGEILTLMGPSGCGKSTLLDVIAGHLSNEFNFTGEIFLNGKKLNLIPAHNREVGILFQDDLLFPHLCVWENLAFALPNSIKGKQRKSVALQTLEHISLSALANALPAQISGGQRARISLIRMLLAQPKLVLLDEPFSKLDKDLRMKFRDWVVEQLQKANIPALMVTHDKQDVPVNSLVLSWPWGKDAC